MYKYKSANISISSVTPTGDLNKHNFAISTSICPTGDLNKYKSVISTSWHISLLHKFMINSNICYCTSITVYAYCTRILMHVYMYKSYVSH